MNARYYNPSTARFLSQDSYIRTAAVAISIADALEEYDLYQSADESAIAVAPELYDLTYKSGLEYNIYS